MMRVGCAAGLTAVVLVLGGCISYWTSVEQAQQERFEAEDQLKWDERETQAQQSDPDAAPSQAIKPGEY